MENVRATEHQSRGDDHQTAATNIPSQMTARERTFILMRLVDSTGVSGTGVVATGRAYTDGSAEIRWQSQATMADGSSRDIKTVTSFDRWEDVILLHGHGGQTLLVWDDTLTSVSDLDILRVDEDLRR
jgi:hypothetical protein